MELSVREARLDKTVDLVGAPFDELLCEVQKIHIELVIARKTINSLIGYHVQSQMTFDRQKLLTEHQVD